MSEKDWHWEDAGEGWIKKVYSEEVIKETQPEFVSKPAVQPTYIAAKLYRRATEMVADASDEMTEDALLMFAGSDEIYILREACRLHLVYELTPTTRGGKNSPKAKAFAAFIEARDAALSGYSHKPNNLP